MKRLILGTFGAGLMLIGLQALAADQMSMSHNDKMMKDCMSKMEGNKANTMSHDEMMKMCKDKMMKGGAMKKSTMSKDSMDKKKE